MVMTMVIAMVMSMLVMMMDDVRMDVVEGCTDVHPNGNVVDDVRMDVCGWMEGGPLGCTFGK